MSNKKKNAGLGTRIKEVQDFPPLGLQANDTSPMPTKSKPSLGPFTKNIHTAKPQGFVGTVADMPKVFDSSQEGTIARLNNQIDAWALSHENTKTALMPLTNILPTNASGEYKAPSIWSIIFNSKLFISILMILINRYIGPVDPKFTA